MGLPRRIAVRESPTRAQADEWALVLAATGIDCVVGPFSGVWRVTVDADDVVRARQALDAYDREQRTPTQHGGTLPDWGPTRVGIVAGILLVVFFAAVSAHPIWRRLGAAAGGRILAGEWWRTVTALTLHANLGHVGGNAVAGALFLTAVCRLAGPGIGLSLALLGGAGANAINAMIRPANYGSIGASTAVFACLGILAGYQFRRRRPTGRARRRRWLPIAAGLALLGWLGTGPNSDMPGHFLGFVLGGTFGVLLAFLPHVSRPRGVQYALVAADALIVIGSWLLAFAFGSPTS